MQKKIIILFFFFISLNSFAQEISIVMQQVEKNIQKKINSLALKPASHTIYPNFNIAYGLAYKNEKETEYSFLFDYCKYNITNKVDSLNDAGFYPVTRKFVFNYNYFFFNPRVTKTYHYSIFIFKYGVSMPMYYKYKHIENREFKYDSVGVYSARYQTFPNEFIVGAMLNGGVESTIGNRFSIGINVEYGLMTYIDGNKYKEKVTSMYNNSIKTTDTYVAKNTIVDMNDKLNAQLYIRYILKKHKK